MLRTAGPPLSAGGLLAPPFNLLFTALLLVALVWLAIGLIERWRVARPRRHLLMPEWPANAWTMVASVVAGAIATVS